MLSKEIPQICLVRYYLLDFVNAGLVNQSYQVHKLIHNIGRRRHPQQMRLHWTTELQGYREATVSWWGNQQLMIFPYFLGGPAPLSKWQTFFALDGAVNQSCRIIDTPIHCIKLSHSIANFGARQAELELRILNSDAL